MKILKFVCGLVLILGLFIGVNAQNNDKVILSGVIMDSMGTLLPDAQIMAQDKNGKKIEAVTQSDGSYELVLTKGIYMIQIKRRSFKTFDIKEYQIAYGSKKMQLDVSLICENCELIEHSFPNSYLDLKP